MNTEIQETVEHKPVFDPDFHTELIIKHEFEDLNSGNFDFCKTRDTEVISFSTFRNKSYRRVCGNSEKWIISVISGILICAPFLLTMNPF